MSQDRERNSLFVPASTQDHTQGALSASVVLVMYGDYQCSKSADVYRMIKVIGRALRVFLGRTIYASSSAIFPRFRFMLKLNVQPKRLRKPLTKVSFGRCTRCCLTINKRWVMDILSNMLICSDWICLNFCNIYPNKRMSIASLKISKVEHAVE